MKASCDLKNDSVMITVSLKEFESISLGIYNFIEHNKKKKSFFTQHIPTLREFIETMWEAVLLKRE